MSYQMHYHQHKPIRPRKKGIVSGQRARHLKAHLHETTRQATRRATRRATESGYATRTVTRGNSAGNSSQVTLILPEFFENYESVFYLQVRPYQSIVQLNELHPQNEHRLDPNVQNEAHYEIKIQLGLILLFWIISLPIYNPNGQPLEHPN